MGVEQQLLEAVRLPLGEIQIGQALHRADEGRRVSGELQREVVGLTLDPT